MILEMARIRVLGPRAKLGATVRALQDRGLVQLVDAGAVDGLHRRDIDSGSRRRRRNVNRALGDVEHALVGLAELGAVVPDCVGPSPPEAAVAHLAARVAAATDRLRTRTQVLVDERDALRLYEPLLGELDAMLHARDASIFLLRLHSTTDVEALRAALSRLVGDAAELHAHRLASGETVVLLRVASTRAAEIEHHLAAAHVERAPLPAALAKAPLADALPRMRPRLVELAFELQAVRDEAASLARTHGDDLARARRGFHDTLLAIDAEDRVAATTRAFILEGWLPAVEVPEVTRILGTVVGPELAIELIGRDEWRGDEAPVVLENPRLFAPFEVLTSQLPLPRYGTIDPTPFVAVFFPMLFGIVVGDVGYGIALAVLAVILRLASKRTHAIAKIAGALALFSIIFGFLYGEFLGDLGTLWFGMRPIWFDRREAVLGFLALAVALGLVHLVLGLVLAAINRWRRDKREAVGRGLTAVMLLLVAVALLALFEELPSVLVKPTVIALLVALPVIIVLEGATALLDFMTILGHVLSYARVMALGTASVMLAVVANRMHGAFGSAAIGVAFALVFHLVNFALTLFSPTIQVMRLHYVEFFGTFFEPGGGPYRPLRRWSPTATG